MGVASGGDGSCNGVSAGGVGNNSGASSSSSSSSPGAGVGSLNGCSEGGPFHLFSFLSFGCF